ncbi:type VII secretion-associated serine protease mycosin [Crossiella cryophila]|uniref:Membrane-anchored mycosin MYCP n=1 Tax=Crossiella cryophila TaxID=43355 RepID=A0A7W7C6I6_9PSEU|nr:type VII secretion-associated serine protease mycosin [Crossiella cryophila]MBB4674311.1 membrane-anchored mycosin MYCP [Crossiella cryophila]
MRRSRRAAALTGVVAAMLAITPVWVAQAQQPSTSAAAQPDDVFPKPPDPGAPAGFAAATKDMPYEQKQNCIVPGNNGLTVEPRPWGQMVLQFEKAWRFATGKKQKVAVIDTGVNPHPRLKGRLEGGGDYVQDGRNGTEDCNGHGTLVAGIIAADNDDSTEGFKGVAPDAKILAFRQTDPFWKAKDARTGQERSAGRLDTLAQAIRRAADDPEVTVINISETICGPVGSLADQTTLRGTVRYAVKTKNKVIVVAAGNTSEGDESSSCKQNNSPGRANVVASPAFFDDDVLTVGAVTFEGERANFSIGGPWVDIAGPGTRITSLDPGKGATKLANRMLDNSGKPTEIQGTSFAAPYVAGVAALVRERYPNLSAYQVMSRLQQTAQHPAGKGGRDFYLGYGMVDPIAALTAVLPEEAGVTPVPPVRDTMPLNPPLEKDWTPIVVALAGAGGGLGLLLLTLFIVHTVQRDKKGEEESALRPLH